MRIIQFSFVFYCLMVTINESNVTETHALLTLERNVTAAILSVLIWLKRVLSVYQTFLIKLFVESINPYLGQYDTCLKKTM